MSEFAGGIAVITGAASGFGLEASRIAAREGMRVVMADVQADALERAAADVRACGAEVLPFRLDISRAAEVEALAAATLERFGTPTFVFPNGATAYVRMDAPPPPEDAMPLFEELLRTVRDHDTVREIKRPTLPA